MIIANPAEQRSLARAVENELQRIKDLRRDHKHPADDVVRLDEEIARLEALRVRAWAEFDVYD